MSVNRNLIRPGTHIAALFGIYLSAAMLLPVAVDLYTGGPDWKAFAISSSFMGALSLAIAMATNGPPPPRSLRFGFLLINLLWGTLALAGAVPFMASSLEMSFPDAIFESVSGITTTGSTVIVGLDSNPPGILVWRSLLQWIGGLGVVAMGLFLLPFLNVGGISYFKLESSDIGDKPFARFSIFMISLIAIYVVLTAICAIIFVVAGMTAFDAVNHSLTTIATGGFSTHDTSFALYADKPLILWTATIFMFIAGLPFSVMILMAIQGRRRALNDPQVRAYACYTIAFVIATAVYLRIATGAPFTHALTHTAFNFVSIITTTGFVSEDYSLWGAFAVGCVFFATFLGGCSGSTAGGIKAYRFVMLFKMMRNGLRRLVYPSSVQTLRYGDQAVSEERQRAVVLFIASFFVIWAASSLVLSATGLDLLTAITGALTALTNVGPGLGDVIGPAGNFSSLSDTAKWTLALTMLLGRLEILTVLVVMSPVFWRT